MAKVPKNFPLGAGEVGEPGPKGVEGDPGQRSQWRLYIMGDHPNAIPGETYSDPSVGDGWLAMGDSYLSQSKGGQVAGTTAFNGDLFVNTPSQPEHAANKAYVDSKIDVLMAQVTRLIEERG